MVRMQRADRVGADAVLRVHDVVARSGVNASRSNAIDRTMRAVDRLLALVGEVDQSHPHPRVDGAEEAAVAAAAERPHRDVDARPPRAPRRGERVHDAAARLRRVGEQRDAHRQLPVADAVDVDRDVRRGGSAPFGRGRSRPRRRLGDLASPPLEPVFGQRRRRPGPTTFAWPRKRSAAHHARSGSTRRRRPGSPRRGRSRRGRTAGTAGRAGSRDARSVTLAGHADSAAMIWAPSRASARADSGNVLS